METLSSSGCKHLVVALKVFHAHFPANSIFFTLSPGYTSCEQQIILN